MDQRNDSLDDPLDLIWTAPRIGEALNVSTRRAMYMLETGKLPARKIGRIWVADRSQLRKHFLGDVK